MGRKIGPYNKLVLADGQMELVGAGAVVSELGTSPETELWAVMDDIDDNDQIDFGDLTFFAPNFGKTRGEVQSGAQTLVFPPNFPDAWRAAPAAPGGEGEAMGDDAVLEDRPAAGHAARLLAAADAVFGRFGIVESERTPPWRRPQIATGGREFRLTDASQQPAPSVIRHSRNGTTTTAPAERGIRWADRWETLEDLLSVLAEQPSDRLLDDAPDF